MYPIVSFFTGWFLQKTTVCENQHQQHNWQSLPHVHVLKIFLVSVAKRRETALVVKTTLCHQQIEFFLKINITRDFPSVTHCHFREHNFDTCTDYVQGCMYF